MFRKKKNHHINLVDVLEKSEEILGSIPPIKKRREKKGKIRFWKNFFYFVLVLLLLAFFFFVILAFKFKNVYNDTYYGKRDIESAVQQIKYKNFDQAIKLANSAQNNFYLAYSEIDRIKSQSYFYGILNFQKQIDELSYILKTAETLSQSASEGAKLGQEFYDLIDQDDNLSFSEFSKEEKRDILKLFYESGPELNGLKANLDLAYLNLKQVNGGGLLSPFRGKINELKQNLGDASDLMEKIIPVTEILPEVSGYPEKSTFLVILQNNDELRPTGGFIGTYGILEIESGDILRFDTHDIYHMDMPVKDLINIQPPDPIKKYLVDKWYMRDSNWSPNWPTSAKNIEWFYHKENNLLPPKDQINNFSGEFNGVIAITPDLIEDLFDLVGPITIEGETYNQDNFTELLEYRVEQSYVDLGVPKWHRKEVIGDISKALKIRMFNLPISRWAEAINIFYDNAYEKNLLVYLKDERSQEIISDLGFSGEVKETNGDYVMVVDSNMAALKTDAVMSRSMDYHLEQSSNGLFAKLKINYSHNGGFDWRTTRYQSYTRVYVPQGSSLIKSEGFESGDAKVNNELGKTVFEGFISVEPGEIHNLYLEYKLPEKVSNQLKFNKYDLIIQKQPGKSLDKLLVDLKMQNDIKSYWPSGFFVDVIGDRNIIWETGLNTDKNFKISF